MADQSTPDYPLEEYLSLDDRQLRVMLQPTRRRIVDLLTERAATTSQLAEALDLPKGTVGHHCKALEAAGLIRVVRTERVRAIQARYYGRTARTFLLGDHPDVDVDKAFFVREALAEIAETIDAREQLGDLPSVGTLRHARIPTERAKEWERRIAELVEEFITEPPAGEVSYGLLVALYPTTRPVLGDDE